MLQVNWEAVSEYQAKQKLTDEKMAEEIGVSKSFYSDVKNLKKGPGRAFIDGLCNLLDRDYRDLFFDPKRTRSETCRAVNHAL